MESLTDYPLKFFLFKTIDSTNQFLKDQIHYPFYSVCCAEKQSAGRGRFGRKWQSPEGENIYLSIGLVWKYGLSKLSGLSAVISLAVRECLSSITNGISIKWPNDLLWQHKKLCGVLIELNQKNAFETDVIIGIGINVNSQFIDSPWISLSEITGYSLDRNKLITQLIRTVLDYLTVFTERSLDHFLDEWAKFDYLYNQYIKVYQGNSILEGYAKGINSLGYLLVQDKPGIIHELSSGEASITSFVPR